MLKKIGLSIDFDFFVREKLEWDFGHSEAGAMFESVAWSARYLSIDLVKECNPDIYADFSPLEILQELKKKGLSLPPEIPLGLADSHLAALEWFRNEKIDRIIHLDAHHDCWPFPGDDPKNVDCGSWLTALTVPVTAVYPNWGDPENHPKPARKGIDIVKWESFKLKEPAIVTKVFLCRSSAWVPPHLDVLFGEMAMLLSYHFTPKELQTIRVRPEPDLRQLAKAREEMLTWQKDAMKKNLGSVSKGLKERKGSSRKD